MKNTQFYIKRHWLFISLMVFGANILGSASSDKLDLVSSAINLAKDKGLMVIKYGGYYKFHNDKKKPFKGDRRDLTSLRGAKGEHELLRAINLKKPENFKIIAGNYKIHLMPKKGEEVGVVKKLLDAASELNLGNINMIKLKQFPHQGTSAGDFNIKPKIVIYPATGKQNAQKVLNEVYKLFKDTEGTDVRPRDNTKVTSLIWIAQGDGDAKAGYRDYFGPAKVYYDPVKMGDANASYYLKHPGTGKNIVPTQQDIQEAQEEDEFSSSSSESDDDITFDDDQQDIQKPSSQLGGASRQFRIGAPKSSRILRRTQTGALGRMSTMLKINK